MSTSEIQAYVTFFISEQKPKVWVVIFLVRSYFSDFSDCGEPDIPHGGLSITSVTVFDGTSTVECDAGYEVIGSTTATCLASKIWDTLPICHPKGTFYFNPFHSNTVNFKIFARTIFSQMR